MRFNKISNKFPLFKGFKWVVIGFASMPMIYLIIKHFQWKSSVKKGSFDGSYAKYVFGSIFKFNK